MWFEKHPNWTVIIAWVIAWVVLLIAVYIVDPNSYMVWFIVIICLGLVYGSLVWNLKVKHRSYFNLLYLLVPLGMIIILCLQEKQKEKMEVK